MPYELETEKLNHKFLNATSIAILLSLGAHFLVFKYGFPTILIKEKFQNREKTVATVELSQIEQARLPDLESNWNVPELNNTSLDEAAPPFALPLPPNFNPSTNLPPIPIPPGYNFPNLPSISSNIELPPLGITDLSALPLPPPIEDLDSLTPPDIPLTTPEKPKKSENQPEKTPTPQPPEVKAPPEKQEQPEATTNRQQIAAARQQKLEGNLSNVSISLQKQNRETTDEEARKNYVNWLSKIEDVAPESIEIQGIYPRNACIRRLEGESVFGVLVNKNNEVIDLELIKGASYFIFNEQAGKDIQQHNFTNETKKTQPYQVTVTYKYDREICPSLTLPSLQEKEQSTPQLEEKPATTPQTEAETKPQPAPTPQPEETQPQTEAETKPQPATKPQPEETQPQPATTPQTEAETKPQPATKPQPEEKPETKPQPATENEEKSPSETEQLPSLRERLQNTPLPDDNTIRERLQKNPIPEKK